MRSSERILISDVLKTKLGSFHCGLNTVNRFLHSKTFPPTLPSSEKLFFDSMNNDTKRSTPRNYQFIETNNLVSRKESRASIVRFGAKIKNSSLNSKINQE